MSKYIKQILSLLMIFAMIITSINFPSAGKVYAQENKLGNIESVKREEYNTFITLSTGEKIRIQFYKDNMIRIYMDPVAKFQENPTPNDEKHTTTPLIKGLKEYIAENAAIKPTLKEENDSYTLSSNSLKLEIKKQNALMKLTDNAGKIIFEETEPIKHSENSTIQKLKQSSDEYFFGGGMQNGRFSHKGKKIEIVNTNNWVDGGVTSPAPFYWSTKGYGVIRNTFKPGAYDFGSEDSNNIYTMHKENRLDAIYFTGNTPKEILNEYTDISGKPTLLPEYAFYSAHLNAYNRDSWVKSTQGTQSARLFEDGNYYVEKQPGNAGFENGIRETLVGKGQFTGTSVIDRYIKHDMPLGWFLPNDGYGAGYGQTDTLDGDIENLKKFADYASGHGIETGLWTQADLHPKDPQNPKKGERDIDKEVKVAGVKALKTDVAWVGSGYDFGLDGINDVYNIMKGENIRPNIVSLDGWVGTQRYAGIWSGDQSGGNWEYIRFHIPTYIGAGLTAIPNVGSDVDGIFGGSNLIQSRDTQFKTFTPLALYMDGWGAYQKNPWEFGEPWTSMNRMYLKLKSELLPYTYSVANESTKEGMPIIRAMFLEYPNEFTYNENNSTLYQYLWGSNFLVAPIYQNTAMDEKGNDIRNDIYLPEGSTWIDYFTGKQYEGGQVLNNFDAPIWKLPLFVKNGSIIPMYKPNNNPKAIDRSYRIFDIYAHGKTSFDVYEDDGITFDKYNKNAFANTLVESNQEGTNLKVKANTTTGSYNGMVKERATEFKIHVSEKPTNITAKVGTNNITLKEVNSLEEFENGNNVYFYNQKPNLNKFATKGSEFEKVEINTTPTIQIKVEKTDVTANEVEIGLENFKNENIVKDTATAKPNIVNNFKEKEKDAKSITLKWDAVENAETYEIEVDGVVYSNIKATEYKAGEFKPNTEHSFKIRARNSKGVSEWSEVLKITTDLDPYRNAIDVVNYYGIKADGNKLTDQGGTPLSKMFDKDPLSQWHTEWYKSQTPFSIVMDLGKIYKLDKLEYLPREDAGNGTITSYSIDYSKDGRNWIKGDEQNWTRSGETKFHDFGDTEARFIKLNVKNAIGGFGAGREFYIHKDNNTEGKPLGDTNNDGDVTSNDLTFFTNYAGLKLGDADFAGYVDSADYNLNNLIDAYDINLVQSIVAKRKIGNEEKVNGKLRIDVDKKNPQKGDIVNIDVYGEGLNDVNALSLQIPYNTEDFKLISFNPTNLLEGMESYSKSRTHTDNTSNLFAVYGNGQANPIKQDGKLFTIKLEALKNTGANFKPTHAMVVDTNLFTKDALADNIERPDNNIKKIPHTNIVASGEDVYEKKAGAPLENVNDGNPATYAELMWDWAPNHDENGKLPAKVKLPQTIRMTPNEAVKQLNKVKVYKRANGNGSLKTILVNVFDGDKKVFESGELVFKKADTSMEIPTNDVKATHVEVTVKDTYDVNPKNPMMTIAEIELYENTKIHTEKVNKQKLQAKVNNLEAVLDLYRDTYTEESVNNLEQKLDAAKVILTKANATQVEVDKAFKDIEDAEKALKPKSSEPENVNKDELKTYIDYVDELLPEIKKHATVESAKAVEDALKSAKAVYENSKATQDEVNKAVSDLEKAVLGIKEKPTVDKTKLKEYIDELEPRLAKIKEVSTEKSYKVLEEKLNKAKEILAKTDAEQADVDKALADLKDSVSKLVEKPQEEPDKLKVENEALRVVLELAQNVDKTKLVDSDKEAIEKLIEEAKALLDTSKDIEKIKAKRVELSNLLSNLHFKPVEPTPSEPEYLVKYTAYASKDIDVYNENGEKVSTLPIGSEITGVEKGKYLVFKDSENNELFAEVKDLQKYPVLASGYAKFTQNVRNSEEKIVSTLLRNEYAIGRRVGNRVYIDFDADRKVYLANLSDKMVEVSGYSKFSMWIRDEKGKKVGVLPAGVYLEGNPHGGKLLVSYNGKTGYIYTANLQKERPIAKGYAKFTQNIRDERGNIIGILRAGRFVKGVVENGKIKVNIGNKTGYIYQVNTVKTRTTYEGISKVSQYIRDDEENIIGILPKGVLVRGKVNGQRLNINYRGIQGKVWLVNID